MPLARVGCVSGVHAERTVLLVGAGGAAVRETFGTGFEELRRIVGVPLRPAR